MTTATEDAEGQARSGPLAALPYLLARSADRDEVAFAELYAIVAPRLFGMALRVLGQRALAEEVTQEVFVVIWTTCSTFDPARGSAISWMLTIAHRRAVDRVRSAHAGSRRDDAWAAYQLESTSVDTTVEEAATSLEAEMVREALRSLSPKHRAAIFLAYFGGQTYGEVALSLGIPPGTAKTRIRDGLRALRGALAVPLGRLDPV